MNVGMTNVKSAQMRNVSAIPTESSHVPSWAGWKIDWDGKLGKIIDEGTTNDRIDHIYSITPKLRDVLHSAESGRIIQQSNTSASDELSVSGNNAFYVWKY